MKGHVSKMIDELTVEIQSRQADDGSFRFCFENSLMTDANMILLLKTFTKEKALINDLADRLASLQHRDGYWQLFEDEEGNISATIEAVFALLYCGYYHKNDPRVKKAYTFILANGGLGKAHSLTKIMLAIHGQYPWPNFHHLPIHLILLPPASPVSFYDFSSYARVHMAPILLLSDRRFVIKNKEIPDMSDLLLRQEMEPLQEETRALLSNIQTAIQDLAGIPHRLYLLARQRLTTYMLQRIEADGTLYSYFSSTFYMIYALINIGYRKNDPLIKHAIQGLKSHLCETDHGPHIQNSPSTIWDTALLSDVLQQDASLINSSKAFLVQHQHTKFGDWMIHAPNTMPGGWGFSKSNTIHPDVDDTTAALRALNKDKNLQNHFTRGLNWVLAMQNEDGGWPAFEKGKTNPFLKYVPMDGAKSASIDPSTADLTGRTLEFLGADVRFTLNDPNIKRGIQWLRNHQEKDGSWYGRWGVTYIYGTWAALTGMRAVGVSADDQTVKNGIHFIKECQNEDGGWGESCRSDVGKTYVPLNASTPSQTAWALDALMSVEGKVTSTIDRGVTSLLKQLKAKDWTYRYPTGAGLPGNFYIYYHSYNYIWPLLVLKKYLSLDDST